MTFKIPLEHTEHLYFQLFIFIFFNVFVGQLYTTSQYNGKLEKVEKALEVGYKLHI